MAVSGTAKAYHEAINYKKFGRGNDFVDIRFSGTRKYKDFPNDTRERYFGSKTFLVWTTDANHLSKTVDITFLSAGIALNVLDMKDELKEYKGWQKVGYIGLRKILYPILIRGIFFEAVYKNL